MYCPPRLFKCLRAAQPPAPNNFDLLHSLRTTTPTSQNRLSLMIPTTSSSSSLSSSSSAMPSTDTLPSTRPLDTTQIVSIYSWNINGSFNLLLSCPDLIKMFENHDIVLFQETHLRPQQHD